MLELHKLITMLTFTAHRSKAELVAPARPTPCETKALSDIDNFYSLRYYATSVEFFRTDGHSPDDPAKAVKAALAEALVYYYPIAGRLRELPDGKLVVDCTSEGVVFVEADADVCLEDFGEPLAPPYPCVEEFFCATGNFKGVVGRPLFFMQVTRLRCGGFVIGFHICHNIADGLGAIQFIKAIADLARGEAQPTVLPAWERELLRARILPRIRPEIYPASELFRNGSTATTDDLMRSTPIKKMVGRYFLFGPREIVALRSHVPEHLRQRTTTFELITTMMWRCRTMALGYGASLRVRMVFPSNARGRWQHSLHIPRGYYGNALVCPTVETTVDELCGGPFGHVLELVHNKAKFDLTVEHMKSMVDAMALLRRKPLLTADALLYQVSDLRHLGEDKLDFGWAQWVNGGVPVPRLTSFHMKCKNADGEEAVAVSMLLPGPAMERFSEHMAFCLSQNGHKFTPSSL